MNSKQRLSTCSLLLVTCSLSFAAGTESAAFLNIPVGGAPAALGGAYSPLATDAYAPVYNPAGLGFVRSPELAGMHLSYLESINYEFASYVQPLGVKQGLGASIQYLNLGNFIGRGDQGELTSNFSGHMAAYSLSYGYRIKDSLSLGITGKVIDQKIEDVSAKAYATDLGIYSTISSKLSLSGVISNLGTKVKFISQSDPLPLTFKVGAAYRPLSYLLWTNELVAHKEDSEISYHTGIEWMPLHMLSLRVGYKTDTTNELGVLAGFTAGVGIHVWGQEFDYAWVPLGDLGNTNYFSLVIRFGKQDEEKRLHVERIYRHNAENPVDDGESMQLMQLLQHDENDTHLSQNLTN